jgi:hypothetical protein
VRIALYGMSDIPYGEVPQHITQRIVEETKKSPGA